MGIEEEAANKFRQILAENITDFRRAPKKKKRSAPAAISINGDSNVVRDVYVVHGPRRRAAARAVPGVHLHETQVARLQQLVLEIEATGCSSRQKIWHTLLERYLLHDRRLLPFDQFPDAEAYLSNWLARIGEHRVADTKRRHVVDIKLTERRARRDPTELRAFLHDRFGKTLLSDCSIGELEIVLETVVRSWLNGSA